MGLSDRDYMKDALTGMKAMRPVHWLDAVTLLIAINVVVFLIQHVFGIAVDKIPGQAQIMPWGALSIPALMEGRVWTLFTHMFVHADLGHVAVNMLMLFMAGKSLQSLIGQQKFLYLFFLAGLVGAVFQFGMESLGGHNLGRFVMFGASGCTCGVFLGLAAMLPREEVTALIYFIIPVRMKLWTMALLLMISSVVFGVLNITGHGIDNVAHFAHLGGALAGWWFVRMLGYSGKPVTYDRLWRERQEREKAREFAGIPRRRRAVDMDEPDNTVVPPRNTREYIEREIDPILEKIHAHGIGSLTDEERKVLERAREEILNLEQG